MLHHLVAEAAETLASALKSGPVPMVQLCSVGGVVNDIAREATGYAHRTQNFALMSAAVPTHVDALDGYWDEMTEHLDGVYLSFDTRREGHVLLGAFPGATLNRLRELKATMDPQQIIRKFGCSTRHPIRHRTRAEPGGGKLSSRPLGRRFGSASARRGRC